MEKLVPALAASLLLLLGGTAAQAQEAREELVLEEVIVTASRRVERLQEVPMSVSAFASDFLQNTGVNQLADLEQYTPNLKITPSTDTNGTSYRIRGIGSVGTNSGIDPSVGMFIDGVYQGRAGMSLSDMIRFLEDRTREAIPGNVTYTIREWAEGLELIRRQRAVVLRSRTEDGMDRLVDILAEEGVTFERVSTTMALLRGTKAERSLQQLRERLREEGIYID